MITVEGMTYRSDQDAALARADALQVDLDRSRAELERTKSLLARREDELARAKARPESPPVKRTPPVPPARNTATLVGGISVLALGVLGLVTFTKIRNDAERAVQQRAFERSMNHADIGAGLFRSCTVRTEPSGARVVSVGADGDYAMGSTPFTRSIGSWEIGNEYLEARLEGYQPVRLTEPPMDYRTDTCETTIVLQPISAR